MIAIKLNPSTVNLPVQVLLDYRSTLVDLEKVILKAGDARLAHFQHKIVSLN